MFCGAQVASRISVPLFEGLVSFSGDSSVSLISEFPPSELLLLLSSSESSFSGIAETIDIPTKSCQKVKSMV